MSTESASKGTITLVHLYPREMSIYGDLGNTRCLAARIARHGYTARVVDHHPGASCRLTRTCSWVVAARTLAKSGSRTTSRCRRTRCARWRATACPC